MLNSKELLIAMLQFMARIEQTGLKEGVTEDMTTIISNLAADLRTIADRKNSPSSSETPKENR